MIISFEQISKSYGANLILDEVSAKIEDNDRIGLIGVNGAGKSTLLSILRGELEADSGVISRSSTARTGFLRQNGGLQTGGTIWNEMDGVFLPLHEMEREMRELEKQISELREAHELYSDLAARYSSLQAAFEHAEGYLTGVKINTVLNGMGFAGFDRETPVDVLSGGEKTRLAICKLLLERPELLILDEPTNHLDFKTLGWLEEYLQGYRGALLVVSHDRYFLDKICTSVWDLEFRKLHAYTGNYSSYVMQKTERVERQWKEYNIQQAEIADLKDFVARNLVRASTTARAQSKRRTLEKMQLVERPKPPPQPAKLRFEFKREPVKDVLHVNDLTLHVGEGTERKAILNGVGFDMMRGEKIALIGSNGVGKSTFLKAIQNLAEADAGEIEWGKNTEISYFEQEDFALDSQKTALDELWDRFPREYEHRIRTVLGNVGLTGENVYKKVGELSGGERAKLKFAVLVLSCGNVLIMDEPTNHLDLAAKEVLDEALGSYEGTLLVVSHDRYLLNRFPTKIAEMFGDRIELYDGGYDAYMAKKSPANPPPPKEKSAENPGGEYYRSKKQRSDETRQKRRVEALESEIEQLEREIFRLENDVSDPGIAADYVLLQEKCLKLEDCRATLGARISEWAEVCDQN